MVGTEGEEKRGGRSKEMKKLNHVALPFEAETESIPDV